MVLLTIAFLTNFQEKRCSEGKKSVFSFGHFISLLILKAKNQTQAVQTPPIYTQSLQLSSAFQKSCQTIWEAHFLGGQSLKKLIHFSKKNLNVIVFLGLIAF